MAALLAVSLVWAFSFPLIKGRLSGLDATAVAALRLTLSLVVFLPFLRLKGLTLRTALALAGIGALQFGVMYVAYLHSFRTLAAHEVALLTVLTPVFVTLVDSGIRREAQVRAHLAAAAAVAGAAVVLWGRSAPALGGALLVQASNLAFAAGQVLYRRFRERHAALRDREVFALLYAGAAALALLSALPAGSLAGFAPTAGQWLVIGWLSVVASGVCFFLWNYGALRVGVGTLAVMNDLKVPLTVLVSLVVFGERTDPVRLAACGALFAAAALLLRRERRPSLVAEREVHAHAVAEGLGDGAAPGRRLQ